MQKFNTLQELFSDPARWTKGVYFRDAEGNSCARQDATCACLAGGVRLVYGDKTVDRLRVNGRINGHIKKQLPDATIASWNDHFSTTIEDVQNLCKTLKI